MSEVFICNIYTHHAAFFCDFHLQYWFYIKLVSTECWACLENTGSYIANIKTKNVFLGDESILLHFLTKMDLEMFHCTPTALE